MIGDDVIVTMLDIKDGHVRIGIDAPPDVAVDREEIRERKNASASFSPANKGEIGGNR